jgi:hypothetical protein
VKSQPTLQTERITLVALADEHLEWKVELELDPEVMRFVSGRAMRLRTLAAKVPVRAHPDIAELQARIGVSRGSTPSPWWRRNVMRWWQPA